VRKQGTSFFALLEELFALPPAQRSAHLAGLEAPPDLRAQLEHLIRTDGSSHGFLEQPPRLVRSLLDKGFSDSNVERFNSSDADDPCFFQDQVGFRVADFQAIRVIGEGSMGTVYEAIQDSPRRSVALKLLRGAYLPASLLRRFQQEVESLGRLEHSGIARIYQAGIAESPGGGHSRLPYIAMEYVRGASLTEHARRNNLTTRQRLELIAKVADAVQYAHDCGVVHRDLKPANIHVDEASGEPKVLDFGVARAANPASHVTAATEQTQAGQVIGTLGYMSPEQVGGDPSQVDARTDVYALGVVAYELLCGRRPLRVEGRTLHEAAAAIRDEEPTRLGTVAAALRGDLETVVAKAIEKEKQRRYASAGEFAADLRRFLNDEPIRARPASTVYVMWKFARRHKAIVCGVAAAFVALVLGVIGTTIAGVRAIHEARSARVAESAAYRSELLAKDANRALRRALYSNLLALADRQIHDNDALAAKRSLAECPAKLRGWEWSRLHRLCDTSVGTIRIGDGRRCGFIRVSPDGSRVLWEDGAGATSAVHVSDLIKGTVVASLNSPTSGSNTASAARSNFGAAANRPLPQGIPSPLVAEWDPLGQRIAVAWSDYTVRIHSALDGTILTRLDVPPPPPDTPPRPWPHPLYLPRVISWSPDGKFLAAGDRYGVTVWNVSTGDSGVGVSVAHWSVGSTIYGFLWNPDGRHLFTASDANGRTMWEFRTGRRIGELSGTVGLPLCWDAPHARILGIATDWTGAGKLAVWQVYTNKSTQPLTTEPRGIDALAVSADRESIAIAVGPVIRLIDPVDGHVLRQFRGHTDDVTQLCWSGDGSCLISTTARGEVKRWNPRAPDTECLTFRAHYYGAHAAAWSPDGTRVASLGIAAAFDLYVWDPSTGGETAKIVFANSGRSELAWNPDGKRVAVIGNDGITRVFEASTLRQLREFTESDRTRDSLTAISWSPDGRRLAVGERTGRVRVYDADTGKRVWEDPDAARVAWSRDGTRIAVAGGTAAGLRILSAADYREILRTPPRQRVDPETGRALKGTELGAGDLPGSPLRYIEWSTDGGKVLAGGAFSPLCVWDAKTGASGTTFQGPQAFTICASWSGDGRRVASAGAGGAVHIWDPTNGQLLMTIAAHQRPVDAIGWSPDSARLLTASQDGTVKVW
jgi:WD40 repeat protein/serine/threonine protein kinase